MSRRRARRTAVEILYAADVRGAPPSALLAGMYDIPPDEYVTHLVGGVESRRVEIDGLLRKHASGWAPERMSVVDRNVLRVAVLELLEAQVPHAVAMDEAVQLAKMFSGPEAAKFVNGVLSGVLRGQDAGPSSMGGGGPSSGGTGPSAGGAGTSAGAS